MGKVAVFIDDVIVGTEFEEVSSVVHTRVEVRRMYSEMNSLFDGFVLKIIAHLADKPSGH